jgi:hypothetical protein
MRTLKLADADHARQVRGSLGRSLVQISLHNRDARSRPGQQTEIPGFDEWQEQWRSNSRLISQRLELIDAELERLSRDDAMRLQLNVFHEQEVSTR